MSDGGWYGYPPQEPDPYAQPQDDRYRQSPEYGNAPQAPEYDQYGRQIQPTPQQQQYYQQQQQQARQPGPAQSSQHQQYRQQQRPQQPQPQPQQPVQNPYFQQQQQQQDYGYDSGAYHGQAAQSGQQYTADYSSDYANGYSTGQQPSVGYGGYPQQQPYDTGGYQRQDYERSGYDTGTGYPAQGYDSAASYDDASYGSGAYDNAGAYDNTVRNPGYPPSGRGQAPRNQAPAGSYPDDGYGGGSGAYPAQSQGSPRDPYADLAELAEEPDEYEYPARGGRRRAATSGEQPRVTDDGRLGLLESEEADSPAEPLPGEDDDEDGGRKRGRSGSKQKGGKERDTRRSCMVIFLFFALIAGGLGYGGYQGYKYYEARYGPPADFSSTTGTAATALVTVPSGAGGTEIASILLNAGVVESERAFVDACDANPSCANIQADTYQLHKQMSAASAVTALLNTGNVYNKSELLVKPGERASAVFADLEQKTGWTQAQIVSAINGGGIDLPSYVTAKPAANFPFANVEGMLFTGTYQLPSYKTPTALLKAMVDQQVAMFNAIGLSSKASSVDMSPYQVLVVASMARAEAGSNASDLGKISGVIYTRLKSSQYDKLGFDTATLYGLGRTEPQPSAAELQSTTNPYNLRVVSGLPPGPIDSVDQTALMAALAPTDSTDVYFCAVNGTIHYASSNAAWATLGTEFPGSCG